MRTIDADALIAHMREIWCKDCDDYYGVRYRACLMGDAISCVDDWADNHPAGQNETDG